MDHPQQQQRSVAAGPSVIQDETVYSELRQQAKDKDLDHVVFAERSWRLLVYGIESRNQDDPAASKMAEHDIAELKAQGVFQTDRA